MRLLTASIATVPADAVVNAANSSLLGGSGVDGAIHRAAGPGLLDECRKLRGCKPGQVKVTSAHGLRARFIFHTVGPVWQGGGFHEAELLRSCYMNCFAEADRLSVASIVFPALSCGRYGYPVREAASVAVRCMVQAELDRPELEVLVALVDPAVASAYRDVLKHERIASD